MSPAELAALIPLPVKTSPDGDHTLAPWDWQWPRSEAYEAAASAVLPKGWTLYSVVDAGKDAAARDYGATRDDGKAHVNGLRAHDGSPVRLRGWLSHVAGIRNEQTFAPGDLAAACRWCDEQLASRQGNPIREQTIAKLRALGKSEEAIGRWLREPRSSVAWIEGNTPSADRDETLAILRPWVAYCDEQLAARQS